MTWSPGAIALARASNGLFFLGVAAYCLVAYTPFVYELFIKPGVVPALSDFVAVSPWLFWVTLLTTILTLMPQLSKADARGRGAAWSYVVAGLLIGVIVLARPPMVSIGNTPKAFTLGMAALVWPVWLAALDHLIWPAPQIRPADSTRVLMACVLSAVIACAVFALASPLRIGQISGVDLPPGMLAAAIGSSLILNLFLFMALFLAIVTMTGITRLIRANASAEYWLLVLLIIICATFVLYLLVCASLQFSGGAAWACSIAFAVGMAAVWANVARLRSYQSSVVRQQPAVVRSLSIDAVALLTVPVASVRSRAAAAGVLVALPFIAYAGVGAVRQFDWNFLLQKGSVLIVWLLAFASAYTVVGERPSGRASPIGLAGMPIAALALYHGFAWMNPETAIDRYAAVDPSLRLIRDARTSRSSATADFYAFLRSHTLLGPPQVQPSDIDFVQPLGAAHRKPAIFLFIVDSMRRDYLSVYNPRVAFTPEIGKLAADSFVFERAWTRYSGTALAVPAIWTGGMVPHMVRQPEFQRRNTLLKLLEANDYLRMMDIDVHVEALVPHDDRLVNLDPRRGTMDLDLCTTVPELERTLSDDRKRPVFFYSLSQNVHLAVAPKRKVPPGETYPAGFDPRMASSLRRLDGCLGGFVAYLKREHLYDDSIIILTSDHGDSLGEEGRWGHAFWMFPEVMNIPLIVHVPSWLKAQVRTDLDALVFSTDIAPTLYALLGYEPRDLGPLFGRSLFTPRDGDSSRRRREAFLVASSYGAVYGVVSQNGRRLYVVDTVNRTEYALDMSAEPRRLAVTPPVAAVNRRFIEQQLSALAAVYRYRP